MLHLPQPIFFAIRSLDKLTFKYFKYLTNYLLKDVIAYFKEDLNLMRNFS